MQQGGKVHNLVIESFRQYFTEQLARMGANIPNRISPSSENSERLRFWTSEDVSLEAACDKSMFENMEKDALRRLTLPLKQLDTI